MIQIPVHNSSGEQIDTLELDEGLLGGEVRPALLKQAYTRYHANRRQGTAATRTRGLVEGSTRKLYRQKGTGNARRGAIRTNIMRGGGVAFGKRPKDWRQDMPAKMRRLANRNALLAKAVDGEVKIVDQYGIESPSTRRFADLLAKLGIDRSCLVALSDTRGPEGRSARNLPDISLSLVDRLNVYDMLSHRYLLVEKQALLDWIERTGNGRHAAAPGSFPADVEQQARAEVAAAEKEA
jgi:large subunit ribosomal protein L4